MVDAKPYVSVGAGRLADLPGLLKSYGVERVMLVVGRRSYGMSGARDWVARTGHRFRFALFALGAQSGPLDTVRAGTEFFWKVRPDAVVGIGGGSVLDVAKLVAVLAEQDANPEAYVAGNRPISKPRRCKLILVPTTAGSGSEVTRFATVFVDGIKYSVDHLELLADAAIVDADLSTTVPPEAAAAAGIDALSHAVESHWSTRSTAISRQHSARALEIILAALEAACCDTSATAREQMSIGATLAGRAIDITRTTAAHALSYPLTGFFGLSHGQGCALILPHLLAFNAEVNAGDVSDPRGPDFVRSRVGELLSALGARNAEDGCRSLSELITKIGLGTRLSRFGIGGRCINAIVEVGLASNRLCNNPRRMGAEAARQILRSAL